MSTLRRPHISLLSRSRLPLGFLAGILLLACILLLGGCSSDPVESRQEDAPLPKTTLAFNGGPKGGTFNYFANKIATLMRSQNSWLTVRTSESGGSLDNLCGLQSGSIDMGLVYSGDAFLNRSKQLACASETNEVRAVAFLYGAPAQLVMRADSAVPATELAGKTIAVGNPGSGAAQSAERFFRHINLWDKINIRKVGYLEASEAFLKGDVDGFWVQVGFPNPSVVAAASKVTVRLVDLHTSALETGFYDFYPFYQPVVIPARTYSDQEWQVETFQDGAIWCVRSSLDPEIAYRSMKAVFSQQGITALRASHPSARTLNKQLAVEGLAIPLHPGAVRYWNEQGIDIPSNLLP